MNPKQSSDVTEKVLRYIKEYDQLAADRGTLESHWQEIAERIYPMYSRTFQSRGIYRTEGEKRNQQMVDSTGMLALDRFAAIMDSLLTPRNSIWHKLISSDPKLGKNRDVKMYFEEVTRLLFKYRYAPKANFASQNQQNHQSTGAFGTACMFVDGLDTGGLRYKSVHVGEIYFRENHQGLIDTAFRYFPMTAKQAFDQWGEKIPDVIKNKLTTNPDAKSFFLHVVQPRKVYDPERFDAKGMKFESCYISIEGQTELEEGGYNVFPYPISRYKIAPGEVYGRSPAMDALPSLKTLNEQKKTMLKQGHRAVDPIILVHDDGILDAFSMKPGTAVPGGVSADGRPLVTTLPVGNPVIGKDLMDDEREVINDIFLITLFKILVDDKVRSATEVIERTREKGILLNPTFGRQQSEYLGPMIDIEIDTLSRQGLLPPMPQILVEAKGEYETQYDSPLSRAARAEEAAGAMRTVETAITIYNVTQDPAVLDTFDFDTMIPELGDINGMPERWKKDPRVIEQMRAQRAAAQQQQAEVEAAPGAAAMMNAATKSIQPR